MVKGSKGFTLAELLVVVAIIAILAGILFPVLRQAQDTARMRTCASNLKQLGQAFAMYVDDNNGFLIPGPKANSTSTLRAEPLMKYVKQSPVPNGEKRAKRMWICPGDRGLVNEDPVWCSGGQYTSSYTYLYDAFLATGAHVDVANGSTRINSPRRPDQWARPTRDALLCDSSVNFHRGRKDASSVNSPDGAVKCVNMLMLDGHITICTKDRMKSHLNYTVLYDNPYSMIYNPILVLR